MSYRSYVGAAALAVLAAGPVLAGPATAPPPARPGAAPAPTAPPPAVERTLVSANSVAVFPFEKPPDPVNRPATSRGAPAGLGEMIAARVRMGLDASGRYTAVMYYPSSPLVMRARGAGPGSISPTDLQTVIDPQRGVINQQAALNVAAAMGTASAVLGSVEDYTYNTQTNKVDLTATVQFLQVPDGTPIKTVGVTASADVPAGSTDEAAATIAANEVARRALTEMGVPPPAPTAMTTGKNGRQKQEAPRQAGRRSGWIPLTILLGILAGTVN